MKKAITILLGITMTAALLAGCGSTAETTQAPAAETAVEETAEAPAEEATEEVTEEATTEAGGVKTGLAVVSSIAKSTNPAEEDGLGEAEGRHEVPGDRGRPQHLRPGGHAEARLHLPLRRPPLGLRIDFWNMFN